MFNDYYELCNGRQIVFYVYKYNLSFAYGNSAKYICRAGRKADNSSESDLNKALVYITSVNDEYSKLRQLVKRILNSIVFHFEYKFDKQPLSDILYSVIKFEDPDKIARMIVSHMVKNGIKVKPEFEKYK